MTEYNEGEVYFVVGYLTDIENLELDLPKWDGGIKRKQKQDKENLESIKKALPNTLCLGKMLQEINETKEWCLKFLEVEGSEKMLAELNQIYIDVIKVHDRIGKLKGE